MNCLTATLEGVAIAPDGTRFPFRVSVGPPYQSAGERGTWRCAVSVHPWDPRLPDLAGSDSLQALCLASRTALDRLRQFTDGGGRVTYDGESDVPLDAYIPTVPRS
jgi:hypothetical protein